VFGRVQTGSTGRNGTIPDAMVTVHDATLGIFEVIACFYGCGH
jgi:hypothetical protein